MIREDREGPCGEGEAHRLFPSLPSRRSGLAQVPPENHFIGSLPSLHPWECRASGSGGWWGRWDMPLPDQARKALNQHHRYNHTGTQFFEIKKSRPLTG